MTQEVGAEQFVFDIVNGHFVNQGSFKEVPYTPYKLPKIDPNYWPNGQRKTEMVKNWEMVGVPLKQVEVLEGLNLQQELGELTLGIIRFFRPFLTQETMDDFLECTKNCQFVTYPKPNNLFQRLRQSAFAHMDLDQELPAWTILLNEHVIEVAKEIPPEGVTPNQAAQLLIRENIAHELIHVLLCAVKFIKQFEIEELIDDYARAIVSGVPDTFKYLKETIATEYKEIE